MTDIVNTKKVFERVPSHNNKLKNGMPLVMQNNMMPKTVSTNGFKFAK